MKANGVEPGSRNQAPINETKSSSSSYSSSDGGGVVPTTLLITRLLWTFMQIMSLGILSTFSAAVAVSTELVVFYIAVMI